MPWFDLGNNVTGLGVQARGTWFRGENHHGLYATGYLRYDEVGDDSDNSAFGFCGGLVAGWAFPATEKLDVRVGGGLQYMRYEGITTDIDTPFIELDLVVGYRLLAAATNAASFAGSLIPGPASTPLATSTAHGSTVAIAAATVWARARRRARRGCAGDAREPRARACD